MRILTVHAHAFGPLTDASLHLAPGLNVVHGPNESGKSTWHAALYAGLCGMRRGPGRRGEDRRFRERHAPWDRDEWEVGVVLELADGRRVELRHDLRGRVGSSARDLDTGRDISGEIMDEGAPDGARFLGLDRRTLPVTICVRQADVLGMLDDPEALQQHLQRAAATGGTDATVEEALQRLRAFRSERVGLARRGSTKPLQRTTERFGRAETELKEARHDHERYRELLARADEAESRAAVAEQQATAAHDALERSIVRELEHRLARARGLAVTASSAPSSAPGVRELIDTVGDAVHDLERLPPEPSLPGGQTADELEAELITLPDVPEGDTEVDPSVEAGHHRWRAALHQLEEHRASRPDVTPVEGVPPLRASELRRLADDLEAPLPAVDPTLAERFSEATAATEGRGPRPTLFATASVCALAAIGLLAAGSVASGVVLAVLAVATAAVAVAIGGRGRSSDHEVAQLRARLALQGEAHTQAVGRREHARRRVTAAGLPPDADAVRRAAATADEAVTQEARTRSWQERTEDLEGRHREAARALRLALEERGAVPADEDLGGAFEAYREACRTRAVQARSAARRSDLRARLESRWALEKSVGEDRARRREVLGRARELVTAVGAPVTGKSPTELAAELRRWLEQERIRARERRRAREAGAALRELLAGRTLEELETEVRRRRERLPPDRGPVELPIDDPAAHVDALDARARSARAEAERLRGQVTDRERGLVPLAEAEEAHERAREELSRIERLARTLDLTQEFLETARDEAQRDIAPRLTAAVAGRLAEVTRGRYEEVTVDPADLDVHVRAPGGRWRRAALLSHGTAEQIYLLLRIAMAEHLITTSEPAPLLLDDVTVHADEDRTEAFLDLLLELGAERQIVLFAQERDVRDWAVKNLEGTEHRLAELEPAIIGS
jgi:hypothetical protein